MNFFAMALDKFPSTFHLQESHKGFFPQAFNQECNFNYSGKYPPIADLLFFYFILFYLPH